MDADDIADLVSDCIHGSTGVDAVVQHPGEVALPAAPVLIDRSAEVRDSSGGFVERRCEITLQIKTSGKGKRGTIVDTGKPDDRWEFKSPVFFDAVESCWVATRVTQS